MNKPQAPDWLASWRAGRVEGPDGPLQVQHEHETHTAWVFLTATHAFKLRKPVDLGFLDYSTVDKRRQASRAEVALGKRISPQVYLGAWSFSDQERRLVTTNGEVGEPIVAMTRLPDALQLERLFADPSTPTDRIDEVALACAGFHAQCPVDHRPDGYGALANTIRAWTINFEQLPASDPTIPLSTVERVQLIDQTQEWLRALSPLLNKRSSEGRVREGHGDLRLQHVYLTHPWSVIDPLEFSIELRFCDVAAEVCFLAMELDEISRADAANRLLVKYAEATADDTLHAVAPFFKRYRAVVRAKVEWIRANQATSAEKEDHLAASRRLLVLALSY